MAEKGHRDTLVARGGRMMCGDPDIKGLTEAQLNALHLCKHEMLAAMCRLYTKIKPEVADALIKKYLGKVIDDGGKKKSAS